MISDGRASLAFFKEHRPWSWVCQSGPQADEGGSEDGEVGVDVPVFRAGSVFAPEGISNPVVANLATAPVPSDSFEKGGGTASAGRTAAQIKGNGLFGDAIFGGYFFHHYEASGVRDQNSGRFNGEYFEATQVDPPMLAGYFGVGKRGEATASLRACLRALRFSSLSCSR